MKHELCYIDVGEQFEISCYDDIIEHTRYDHVSCCIFISLNYSKKIEELVLIF